MIRQFLSGLFLTLLTASNIHAAPASKPTFVLVHGALFTSAGWSRVQAELQERGFNVVTLDVPGRNGDGLDPKKIDINVAAKKVEQVAILQSGSVILVGHSQGGALITQAANALGKKVKALVYVAAVIPNDKETAFQQLNPAEDKTFPLSVDANPERGHFQLKKDGPHEENFFQDLRAIDPALADFARQSMVSEPMGIGTTTLNYSKALLAKIPKYYIETTEDRVVSLHTQRRFQKVFPMRKVFTLKAGHSPFLSKPSEVVDALVETAG